MDLLKILDGTPEPHIIDLHLDSINDGGEYNLGVPMYEFQKELTDQIVSLHYPDILKYCETNDSKDLIVKSLQICINNCMLVSTHPYLLIKHYMPKNFAQKDMSRKLSETSGKFSVLKDLINVIIDCNPRQSQPKNIGILCKNEGRFFDLTEALLMGCHGNKSFKRYCGQNVQRESKKTNKKDSNGYGSGPALVNIHLLPGDGQLQRNQDLLDTVRFDVLIVLDAYVDTGSEFFDTLRRKNRNSTEKCVMIRLVPIKTIEHCILSNENSKDLLDYLYRLILSIVCLREFNGNLLPDVFPIYNQKLTYLSDKFFKYVFPNHQPNGKFPAWPLPELPKIPHFAPQDVEKSLLTEVHFHYTPYDSADSNGINPSGSETTRKRTYYESKRLELDYLTNPLKNDYSKLIGIDIHGREKKRIPLLTHSHVLQLNSAHMDYNIVKQELDVYDHHETSEVQNRVGRRIKETKTTLANVIDDLLHSEMRIASSAKLESKKTTTRVQLEQETAKVTEKIQEFCAENNITNSELIEFVSTQQKIWQLRSQIKDSIARVKSKDQENAYVRMEYEKCVHACSDSEIGIEKVRDAIKNDVETKDLATQVAEQRVGEFNKSQTDMDSRIKQELESSKEHKQKLDDLFKFLRGTSHLRKRKGRTTSAK